MVISSDVLLRGFNNLGFNVVRRPDDRLTLLDVLVRDDVLERIGTLQSVVTLAAPLLTSVGPTPAVNLDGQIGSQLHITSVLGSLKHWLRALSGGATIADLAPAFASARFLQFRLDAPMMQHIDPHELASRLGQARVAPASPLFRYLQDRNTDLFVVTEIIQTDRVTVKALDVGSSPVLIDVPALAAAVGYNVKVSTTGAVPSWVTCQGREPVTMAFKVARVRRDRNGSLSTESSVPAVLFAPGTLVAVA